MGLLSAIADLWGKVAAPILLSLVTCASAAVAAGLVRWLFARYGITEAAVRALYDNQALQKLMYPQRPLDAEWDSKQWVIRESKVLLPAIDAIECFAASTNPRRRLAWPWHSFRVVKRMASQRLISLWELRDVQHVIESSRRASDDPSTTYLEFELLVTRLKAATCSNWRRKKALKREARRLRRLLMP